MNNLSEVNQRIDLIRRQLGWTQEQMAQALNLSQPAVSKYLKDRIPPAETLLKLAEIGNTTIEWILTGQKSYFYQQKPSQVADHHDFYDAELLLAKKIASLPAPLREAILSIISYAISQGK